MYNNQFKSTANHQKNNSRVLSNNSIQQGAINSTIFQSNSVALKTFDNNGIIQLHAIDAWDGVRRWFSSDGFDDKHYCAIPDTDQEWLDWRLSRWPGFSSTLPACTLITGNLNTALGGQNYNNLVVNGNFFRVTVTCNARSVQPYNPGNALTINNLRLINHTTVDLGGVVTPNYLRINHLFFGN